MIESDIENAFVEYAKDRGCLAVKLRVDGQIGFPDRSVFTPNGVFFIEFKKPGGRLSISQQAWISKIQEFGFQCFVIDELDEAKQRLNAFLSEEQ